MSPCPPSTYSAACQQGLLTLFQGTLQPRTGARGFRFVLIKPYFTLFLLLY